MASPEADAPLPTGKKSRQIAALPWRQGERGIEVLLVTSRETHRWIIPKGWPMKGKKPHRAAEREALEEAGVKGRVSRKALGAYEAWKRLEDHFILCDVKVYPLLVEAQRKRWREKGQRQFAWLPAQDAADIVDEPGLRTLLRTFGETAGKKKTPAGKGEGKAKGGRKADKSGGKKARAAGAGTTEAAADHGR